jgi:putative flippase GtrA
MSPSQIATGRAALRRQATIFGLVGLVNTAVGYGTIIALMAMNLGPVVANAGGYALGLFVSYLLNSRITFSHSAGASDWSSLLRFLISFALAWLLNLIVLTFALGYFVPAIAQGLAMVSYTLVFFVLSRSFVFPAK